VFRYHKSLSFPEWTLKGTQSGRVYQVNGGSDLVDDHLVGMRPGNVIANAFRAGFVRREALLFEWR
jgi:hypothetical protein